MSSRYLRPLGNKPLYSDEKEQSPQLAKSLLRHTIKAKECRFYNTMKATTFALILLSILTGTCLTSCIDDDFTTNPSHVLAFSTDTVAFDTVFTTIGTSTRSFRIYNRNKKSLNISSIKLADAEHSGFHINVDGMSGDNFTHVEIRGKDSL